VAGVHVVAGVPTVAGFPAVAGVPAVDSIVDRGQHFSLTPLKNIFCSKPFCLCQQLQ